jgi:beta-galactosidase
MHWAKKILDRLNMKARQILFLPRFVTLVCLLGLATACPAEIYTVPASHRTDVLLDPGWRFIRQNVTSAEKIDFDDAVWSNVNLPHTWNNLDGEDGGDDYYRGIGWYRKHFQVAKSEAGHRFFLKFDGASLVADVWVNGQSLGEHRGGFGAFVFDATPFINIGADNVLAVKVNNAPDPNIPPLDADFTFFGGLYRDVHLLETDPVQISPLDYGSSGVYLQTTGVNSHWADLQITTLVSNSLSQAKNVTLRAVITDAAGNIVGTLTNSATISPGSLSKVVERATIAHPHLWDGLADPYLYHAFVEIRDGVKVLDVVAQPLGFRSFHVDPDKGFFLNDHYYDLHGVCLHQDWQDCGWVLNESQRQMNFSLLKEIGATAVRLSHYQNADRIYQLADENGIALWTEIPLVDRITDSPEFYANAEQQLTELIRQNYNHPSIICWGIFNEITLKKGPQMTNLVSRLAELVGREDTTRPSTCAVTGKDDQPSNWYSKIVSFNKYFGWYNGTLAEFAPSIDKTHAKYPTHCMGVSEFGAGGSIHQHSEDPVAKPVPTGHFHPEEYENLFHETYWQAMKQRPYLWCKFLWNMADFAIDNRNEGDTAGRNDKGLVTYDRRIRKDAFYWYQANWTTRPMVYITGHTFTNRLTNSVTAKVYANGDSVELYLNGTSQGVQTSTNCIFTWPIVLSGGTNTLVAVSGTGAGKVTDSLVWNAPATRLSESSQ